MKILLRISCLCFVFIVFVFFVYAEQKDTLPELPETEARISMDFRDADLKDVLKIFSQQSGINFIPSEDVQDKKVTLFLENVPVKNAIDSIIQANTLTYEQGPDKNIFIVRPSGVVKIKTLTKVYTLNFAQVAPLAVTSTGTEIEGGATTTTVSTTQSIVDILSKLLSPAGNIVIDQRTNSLIITDIPEQFKVIEEMIIKLDTPTPQVFIEAEIVETTVDVTDRLGLEYGGSSGQWTATFTGPKKGYSFPYDTKTFKDHGQSATFTFGTMTFGDLAFVIKALRSEADTKYLARPRLLTLNNETAIIDITSDTYVGSVTTSQSTTGTTSTSAERMTTGLTLKVTPQINAADYVTVLIEPSVSRTEASAVNTDFLNPIKRSAKAKVMVKDGETIFIGGLLDTQKTDTKRRVPVLSQIPIAGALFKSDTVTDKQTEILIFLTPHIVRSKVIEETRVAAAESPRAQLIEEAIKEIEKK